MPENVMPGPVCDLGNVREAVCIHTRKIFDSCRDKDCVEDLRFYPTAAAQEVLSTSQMIKGGHSGAAVRLHRCGAGDVQPGVLFGGYALLLPGDFTGVYRHAAIH